MLTKEQVAFLFQFCQDQGVVCYDVQVELVDHLGSAIEKELTDHPEWTFFKALDVVFVSFGYRKFKPLIWEKSQAAKRYCRRLFWAVFREQLRWPAIWPALPVFLYLYKLLALYNKYLAFYARLAIFLIVIGIIVLANKKLKRLQERADKKFMLVNMTRVGPLFPYSLMFIGLIDPPSRLDATRPYFLFIGTLVFAYFLMGIAYYRTMMRLKDRLKKDYPEVFKIA
jgi:hypothetical protein